MKLKHINGTEALRDSCMPGPLSECAKRYHLYHCDGFVRGAASYDEAHRIIQYWVTRCCWYPRYYRGFTAGLAFRYSDFEVRDTWDEP